MPARSVFRIFFGRNSRAHTSARQHAARPSARKRTRMGIFTPFMTSLRSRRLLSTAGRRRVIYSRQPD